VDTVKLVVLRADTYRFAQTAEWSVIVIFTGVAAYGRENVSVAIVPGAVGDGLTAADILPAISRTCVPGLA